MKKLLQINCAANWGSTGKIAEQIGLCAQAHGWDSYIAYGRWDFVNPSKNNLIKIGSLLDPYIHYAENLFLDNEGLSSRRATKKFLKQVDEIKPDIVHLHNIHDHYLNYKLLFTYLAEKNIPVVWTQHDQWAIAGHCMHHPLECERWKDVCHDCPMSKWYSLDRSRRNHLLKKSLSAAIPSLTIVPVSNWIANNFKQSHLKNRPIEVIHNGIDVNTFSPQQFDVYEKYGIDKKKRIILGVATNWVKTKGLNDFYTLAERLPQDDYAIIIVGRLLEEPRKVNCCQMIFVDRTQNAQELAQLYSKAFAFVNLTYMDTFPTTNLESLACGTPVITYNTGGSPEAIDEKTGIVVEQGDIEGIAQAIYKLKDNPLSSEDCRKRAEEHFDKNKCFEKCIDLYESILSTPPNPAD